MCVAPLLLLPLPLVERTGSSGGACAPACCCHQRTGGCSRELMLCYQSLCRLPARLQT